MEIKIVKLNSSAKIPSKATVGAAGHDLYACIENEITLKKGDRVLIPCGIAFEIPDEHCGAFVFARSGLGIKHGISLSNGVGVIDSDYRGEICVGLCKFSGDDPYTIKNGDRIAQIVFIKTENVSFNLVESLGSSQRGSGGFGSTGN